jgi:ABC-2 type transport system ATP-binding protein
MVAALDRAIGEYSHGMKRKIQLVAATSHGPALLILDEPFRGLDPDASAVLRELIRAVAESGRAVLIATHDMLRAQRDCDTVTILHAGRTVAQGTPDGLMTASDADSLETVFMRHTGLENENGRRIGEVHAAFDEAAPLDVAREGQS